MISIFFIVYGLILKPVSGSASSTTLKTNQQRHLFSPYDYLQAHKDKPVNFLASIYYPDCTLAKKFLDQNDNFNSIHPAFTVLSAKKTSQQTDLDELPLDLHNVISDAAGFKYIDQHKLVPLTSKAEYSWLLKEYGAVVIDDNEPVEITIEGMLYDLGLRAQQGNTVANTVLTLLKNPYYQRSRSTGIIREYVRSVSENLFWWLEKPDPLIQELNDSLNEKTAAFYQRRYCRMLSLLKSGYHYKQNYLFTDCDEVFPSSAKYTTSDYSLIRSDESVANMLETCYMPETTYPNDSSSKSIFNYLPNCNSHFSMLFASYFSILFGASLFHGVIANDIQAKYVVHLEDLLPDCQNSNNCMKRINGTNTLIEIKDERLYNQPISSFGGQNNLLIVKDTEINVNTNSIFPGIHELAAFNFSGDNNRIMFYDTAATFTTNAEALVKGKNYDRPENLPTVYASNLHLNINASDNTVRITDSSSNSAHRIVAANKNRLEIMHNGVWVAISDKDVNKEALDTACHLLDHDSSSSLRRLQAGKDRLLDSWQKLNDNHWFNKDFTIVLNGLDKNCDGCENSMLPCKSTEKRFSSDEFFIECASKISEQGHNIRLTSPPRKGFCADKNKYKEKGSIYGIPEKLVAGEWLPFCLMNSGTIAKVACEEMGYALQKGYFFEGNKTDDKNLYCPPNLKCNGIETNLNACDGGCNQVDRPAVMGDTTPYLRCYEKKCQEGKMRLAPRFQTADESYDSEDVTDTGNGMLEYCMDDSNFYPLFFSGKNPLAADELQNEIAKKACQKMGFPGGQKSTHLAANSAALRNVEQYLVFTDNMTSSMNNSQIFKQIMKNYNFKIMKEAPKSFHSYISSQQESNATIVTESGYFYPLTVECDSNKPPISPKRCPKSGLPSKFVWLSGKLGNWDVRCEPSECPGQLIDLDGVVINDARFLSACDNQLISTTKDKDLLIAMQAWCAELCLLPNDKVLSIASYRNKKFIVSRMRYLYNSAANSRGLIRVTWQNPSASPQLFTAANETLIADALPIMEEIIHGHLVSIYYSDLTKTGQLVWFPVSSKKQLNNKYYVQTLPGKPIALTKNKVILYNSNKKTINQYALSAHCGSSNNMIFTISTEDTQIWPVYFTSTDIYITANNIIAATIQEDKWLYIAINTNRYEQFVSDKITLMRFNLLEPTKKQAREKEITQHIDDHEHYRLLINNNTLQIVKDDKSALFNHDVQHLKFPSFNDTVEKLNSILDIPPSCIPANKYSTTNKSHSVTESSSQLEEFCSDIEESQDEGNFCDTERFPYEIPVTVAAVAAVGVGLIMFIKRKKICNFCNENCHVTKNTTDEDESENVDVDVDVDEKENCRIYFGRCSCFAKSNTMDIESGIYINTTPIEMDEEIENVSNPLILHNEPKNNISYFTKNNNEDNENDSP